MCRIVGVITSGSIIKDDSILRMRDAMQHGGPDDAGIYVDADHPLAFGHRRLSLIDLSALGHQPMQDASGQLILIFNGEIYNFQVIRTELEQLGYSFRSHSDTEVILYAYQQWGKDCLQRFNGMFAFALLDKQKNTVLLARDHAGIKPLYYGVRNGQFCFASEVRAFTAFDPSWPENNDWRKYFLLFGHLPEPITTLQDVQPLAKGQWLEYNLHTHQYQTGKFFQLYYNYTIHDEETAVDKVRAVLRESVQRHLISDAPIGLFLSGGLDSSLLTLLAKPVVGDNLHTLSIVFENDKFSEKLYQDIVIQATGAQHRSFLVTEKDFFDNMPDIIKAMDQPSNDGINSYFICRYAKAYGLKAVLSGLGADELFGGYPTFNRTNVVASVRWLPDFMFAVTGIFPDDKRKRFSFLQVEKGLGEYLFNRGFFLPAQVASLLDCTVAEVESALEKILLP
ncbi:MAG: asparagine synthase (glutamine-hydrolyzing), partial [Chitinophagaceae bacterium]|nr:asparagine synthase (glutamine-hydrolyzing) [Chitinophagaceae bacterium]